MMLTRGRFVKKAGPAADRGHSGMAPLTVETGVIQPERISYNNGMKNIPINYNSLKQACIWNPSDRAARSAFIGAHEDLLNRDKGKTQDEEGHLTYLKLRSLYGAERWKYLGDLGRIYLHKSKLSLSFMCFVESLRLNPRQQEIFVIAQILGKESLHRTSGELGETACKVSVIMPTYNRGEMIRESIRSVLDQTFQDFELLIVNDGGDDEVKAVIDSFDQPRIRYYKLRENRGLSGALNEGIVKAHGEYIAYLDDDDVYYPDHLETLTDFMEKDSRCDVAYSNAWWCFGYRGDSGFVEESRESYGVRPDRFRRDVLRKNNYISTLNILHKKGCFRAIGLFNEDLTHLMDWEMWMRFSDQFSFQQVNKMTGEYRWHKDNMSTRNLLEMEFVASILMPYYEWACGKIAFIKGYLHQGDETGARKLFKEVVGEYQSSVRTPSLARELFYLANQFRANNGSKITRDYFMVESRNCLKEIVRNGRLGDLCCLVDLIPLKAAESARHRIAGCLSHKGEDVSGRPH
jgi:glycosyltransferase involved in cell wall biosynthesis